METLDSLRSGLASGRLAGCQSLKLADDLREFPLEILDLADSLTFLNLSNNRLTQLPPSFAQLQKLEIVFFNNNSFESFPIVLAQCPQLSMVSFKNNAIRSVSPQALSSHLRWLILTNNQLSTLPPTVGKLHRLQKFMLAGNQLESVPPALENCQNLELIRLSANRLKALPKWLLDLPKLSWIAYAGNPCCPSDPAERVVSDSVGVRSLLNINPSELQIGDILGQGASGVIYQAQWTPTTPSSSFQTSRSQPQTVALKIFKGDITSDGSPQDEMKACIAAGTHENLVSVLGQYCEANNTGLVFDFIPPDYQNLGGPPSLETCTRDTYESTVSFSAEKILAIIKGIAAVVAHLHRRGIMHGDLYAHNILINADGHSILGDFGAASIYDVADVGPALEQLEVRAFGCLLEDLLDRCSSPQSAALLELQQLQADCIQPKPSARPLFEEICQRLDWLT
ncbi:MAG: leucine-rich repeat-containing protein kinase family protein [Cyanobacteria bacterium J06598_1]